MAKEDERGGRSTSKRWSAPVEEPCEEGVGRATATGGVSGRDGGVCTRRGRRKASAVGANEVQDDNDGMKRGDSVKGEPRRRRR